MKIIAITQARIGSTRLPAKVLKEIDGKSLLQIHIERASKSKMIDKLIVSTTDEAGSEKIVKVSESLGTSFYIGSTYDVLDRYYQAAKMESPDYVVRITSDCPLIDSEIMDEVIDLAIKNNSIYCSNVHPRTFPVGTDVEVFKFSALEDAWENAKLPQEREHVTPYIVNKYKIDTGAFHNYSNPIDLHEYRITVDFPEDFELISKLVNALGSDKSWITYIDYMKNHSELVEINAKYL